MNPFRSTWIVCRILRYGFSFRVRDDDVLLVSGDEGTERLFPGLGKHGLVMPEEHGHGRHCRRRRDGGRRPLHRRVSVDFIDHLLDFHVLGQDVPAVGLVEGDPFAGKADRVPAVTAQARRGVRE